MEQPRWTSSRVANRRVTQSSTPASASASARPGATSAPSTSGAAQSRWAPSSSSSTWRTQPPAPAPRVNSDTRVSNSATGASSSRWARTSAPSDHDMAALTATLGSTLIRDSGRRDGLHVRDTTRPLGGKTLDRLALLASPSRGLDSSASISSELASQGSMDLTSASVQAELRGYIGDRITTRVLPLLSAHVPPLAVLDSATYLGAARASAAEKTAADEELGQLMLQTRKLREAVVASQRVDAFAVDVYELSTYMALLCADVPQLAATLPRLVTELYPRMEPQDCPGASGVRELATRLGLEMYDAAERRMRMCSVYLLYVLCLSGRAVRLGQYAQDAAGGTQHGLREYRLLRSKLLARYPDLEPHVRFCDRVYTALRGADPLQLARILRGNDAEYRMDGWQRMLVLHAVPAVRAAAWQVATKAYMHLPVSSHLAGIISPDAVAQPSPQTAHESHLASLLLLQTDILPPASPPMPAFTASSHRTSPRLHHV
ncbi:hypothetical protein PaG_05333 [Moesziomyces aphidis]|uniref:Uncharacterized protein n=1 Tax=Moesziomyces aphidis TaxID=84754 RepID=W3VG02_MOEAP|nr:hypothetical protein PaG_05333 [Moesziomyces aphidis]